MHWKRIVTPVLFSLCFSASYGQAGPSKESLTTDNMLVRMAEIEIDPQYLDEYLAILREGSEKAIRLEPGVIAIYPMFRKADSTQIKILEIYADRNTYEAHLNTTHFKTYKSSTLHMVKSLNLIDMEAIDVKTMPEIFKKIRE